MCFLSDTMIKKVGWNTEMMHPPWGCSKYVHKFYWIIQWLTNHFEDVIIFGGITVFRQILKKQVKDIHKICMVQDRHKWRTFLNTVMNFQIP